MCGAVAHAQEMPRPSPGRPLAAEHLTVRLADYRLEVDDERPPPLPDDTPDRSWYGWQTLLIDAASIAMLYSESLRFVGFATLTLGSPVVHLAHGHASAFGMSLALRGSSAFVVAVGYLVAVDAGAGEADSLASVAGGIVLAGGAGFVFAVLYDAVVLAFTTERPTRRATGYVSVAPWLDRAGRGAGVSVAARL